LGKSGVRKKQPYGDQGDYFHLKITIKKFKNIPIPVQNIPVQGKDFF
jgi:hypothetical protein